MTGKELWDLFIKENNMENQDYEAWAFGMEADALQI